MAANPLTNISLAYGIPSVQVEGKDFGAVLNLAGEAIRKIRAGEGPQFIEAQTIRFPGSATNSPRVPVPTDASLAWDLAPVPEAERDWYRDEDPILIFIRDLVEAKQATKEEIVQLELNARAAIDQAVKFALASPDPTPEVALQDVFV